MITKYFKNTFGLTFLAALITFGSTLLDARNESGYFDFLFGHDSPQSKNVQAVMDYYMSIEDEDLGRNLHLDIRVKEGDITTESIYIARNQDGTVTFNQVDENGVTTTTEIHKTRDLMDAMNNLHSDNKGIIKNLGDKRTVEIGFLNRSYNPLPIEIAGYSYQYSTGIYFSVLPGGKLDLSFVAYFVDPNGKESYAQFVQTSNDWRVTYTDGVPVEHRDLIENCEFMYDEAESAMAAADAILQTMSIEHDERKLPDACDELDRGWEGSQ